MTARAVTEATFEQEVLQNEKTVLVDFWAEWCGPCRMVSPILDQIAAEHSDKLDIVKLDVDANPPGLAMKYQITAIPPAMKVFKAGGGRADRHRCEAQARARGRPRRLHRVVGRPPRRPVRRTPGGSFAYPRSVP